MSNTGYYSNSTNVEYKINKKFNYNGLNLKPVESNNDYLCLGCIFDPDVCDMKCKKFQRRDFKNVIFVKAD